MTRDWTAFARTLEAALDMRSKGGFLELFAAGARFLTQAVDRLRAQVRLGPLTQALVHLAWAAVHTGEWEVAAAASASHRYRFSGRMRRSR